MRKGHRTGGGSLMCHPLSWADSPSVPRAPTCAPLGPRTASIKFPHAQGLQDLKHEALGWALSLKLNSSPIFSLVPSVSILGPFWSLSSSVILMETGSLSCASSGHQNRPCCLRPWAAPQGPSLAPILCSWLSSRPSSHSPLDTDLNSSPSSGLDQSQASS